jgi:hypothetical protein
MSQKSKTSKQYIYIFDFDLTLTTKHSQGTPSTTNTYINSTQSENIIYIFDLIKKLNPKNKIIILSRGIQSLISKYLKNNHTDIFAFLNEIIGLKDQDQDKINQGSKQYWAEWKCAHMNKIKSSNNNCEIIFFDDTVENVVVAQMNGFIAESIDEPWLLKQIVEETINRETKNQPKKLVNNNEINYKDEYIKYKSLYVELKKSLGVGINSTIIEI